MVDRLLQMLNQFLVSNQELSLNNTFKLYLHVLSIEHMKHKNIQPVKTRLSSRKRKHFGIGKNQNNKCYYLLDVPQQTNGINNVFHNKCLITCIIIGYLQNIYFETCMKDNRYKYLLNIHSKIQAKQKQAFKILQNELEWVLDFLISIDIDLEDSSNVIESLSHLFSSQIFLFYGLKGSAKLKQMHPPVYDDKLKPIYLFQFFNENHIAFIKHIKAYFKKNTYVCFSCKKVFKNNILTHLCSKSETCFSCRRRFQSHTTYLNFKIKDNFCDKNISNEEHFLCSICNITVYSHHCYLRHRKICGKKGYLGWKCTKCNRFFYRSGSSGEDFFTSDNIKKTHICGAKMCPTCRVYYKHDDENFTNAHLCTMKIPKLKSNSVNYHLAFLSFQCINQSSENCLSCFEIKKEYKNVNNLDWKDLYNNGHFSNLMCDYHCKQDLFPFTPNFLVLYLESKNAGNFDKFIFSPFNDRPLKIPNAFKYEFLIKFKKQIPNDKSHIEKKTSTPRTPTF